MRADGDLSMESKEVDLDNVFIQELCFVQLSPGSNRRGWMRSTKDDGVDVHNSKNNSLSQSFLKQSTVHGQ